MVSRGLQDVTWFLGGKGSQGVTWFLGGYMVTGCHVVSRGLQGYRVSRGF